MGPIMSTSSPPLADGAREGREHLAVTSSPQAPGLLARMQHPATRVLAVAVAGYVAMSVTLVAIGLLITHGLSSLTRSELGASRWFVNHRTAWGNDWTGWASRIADTVGILVVLVVAVVVLVALRRRWSAVLLAVALALEVLTFITVNTIVGRPRPPVERLGSLPSTSSFPSGHTAAMMAIYGALAITIGGRSRARSIVCWIIAVIATIAVGYARVYRGMHHVSDVTAGALMGLAALAVASAAVRAGKRPAESPHHRPTFEHREVTS